MNLNFPQLFFEMDPFHYFLARNRSWYFNFASLLDDLTWKDESWYMSHSFEAGNSPIWKPLAGMESGGGF